MLTIEKLNAASPCLARVEQLYYDAFPPEERRTWDSMVDDPAGDIGIWGLYHRGEYCGFVILMTQGDICHNMYFAIEERFRDQGLGAQALAALRQRLPGLRIIVDIEQQDPAAENSELRRRRKAFYLRCGYRETGVFYSWQGVSYEILCDGGPLTDAEFHNLWKQASERRKAALAARVK